MTAASSNEARRKQTPANDAGKPGGAALAAPATFSSDASGSLPAAGEPWERDSYSSTAVAEVLDRASRAALGRVTLGLSPAALAAVYLDWITHLAFSPGKQLQLVQKAQKKLARFWVYAMQCALSQRGSDECAIDPLPQDKRFRGEAWRQWPFNVISQSFLFTQQWWHNATTGVRGVTPQHERAAEFASRQILDVFSPSNFILTNPEVLQRTMATGGANLVQGWRNAAEDVERTLSGKPPAGAEAFKVGETVAVTPGKVVYRNRLIELIQYSPATGEVYREPVLITPAWIMKYYILDLSPENSLVKYLVDQGHTVFMISWKNPGPEDRDLGMEDYRKLGVMAALDAVEEITGVSDIHGVGYCLGGTLLGIAAAAMAGAGDERFKSLTFFASQFDFTEAGELSLFINESQVAFLEDVMWEQGFLDAAQMAGAFQLLRSNDLIWSRVEHEYLMGERQPMIDLMAWNADTTRMPFRMHSEYLRSLFLNNDLAEGRYRIGGRAVAISDIRAPVFCVATTQDHVAPWRSVYKTHLLADTEVTFVLTGGGHNAGIVSEPGRKGRKYRARKTGHGDLFADPDLWLSETPETEGSWWPEWTSWLAANSGEKVAPPEPRWVAPDSKDTQSGHMIAAPGTYVHMK